MAGYMAKGNRVKVTHLQSKFLNQEGVITQEDTPYPGHVEVEIQGTKRSFNVCSLFDITLDQSQQ